MTNTTTKTDVDETKTHTVSQKNAPNLK